MWIEGSSNVRPEYDVLLIYLNAGVLDEISVQSAIDRALDLGTRIALIYERDGRHGAPLNKDGGFDFAAILNGRSQVFLSFQVTLILKRKHSFMMCARGCKISSPDLRPFLTNAEGSFAAPCSSNC